MGVGPAGRVEVRPVRRGGAEEVGDRALVQVQALGQQEVRDRGEGEHTAHVGSVGGPEGELAAGGVAGQEHGAVVPLGAEEGR